MDGHELDHGEPDGKTKALDAIRTGADQLIISVRQRVVQALDALDEGRFTRSAAMLADAITSVQSLMTAQQTIAIAEGATLMLAADVTEGMYVTNVGEVTDVEIEPCANEMCRRHITIKVGEHTLNFRGDQEVYVTDHGAGGNGC